MHAAWQIALAAKQRLMGLPTTGNSVHLGRTSPMATGSAPFLLVYPRPEQSAPVSGSGPSRKLQRELTLAVEGVVAEADDESGEALVWQIAAEVEVALAGDPTLGGTSKDLYLNRIDPNARAEGETRTGHVRLEFTVRYFTAANAPNQAT